MSLTLFLSIAATGFVVAFAHAAIPTHWLPFVLAGRGQRWSRMKTLAVVGLCGTGHVLFTAVLGALVVWLGIETSRWTGEIFPWIAGGILILIGIYYLIRQVRGGGHGHRHFGVGHRHDDGHGHGHDHGPHGHTHASGGQVIDTGHGTLTLEVFADGVPPRFRVSADMPSNLPHAAALTVETLRSDGARQVFTFVRRAVYLESLEAIAGPPDFTACVRLSHGSHAHEHEVQFAEHRHDAVQPAADTERGPAMSGRSDGAVILGLLALLTFSPCEGFLPVYLSGIAFGWVGFALLSMVLAIATVAGMMVFTWLTLLGVERLRFDLLERYESGILGAIIIFLGLGIIFLGF